jgi:Family of unknown function (DUF5684)
MAPTMAVSLWQEQPNNPLGAFFFAGLLLFWSVALLIGMWKVFAKAGQPGWAALVPIYNLIILVKIVGRPAWWVLLCFIPLANVVFTIVVAIDVAKAFGQSAAFGFFLIFLLGGIGYLILGFGNYRYLGPPNTPSA